MRGCGRQGAGWASIILFGLYVLAGVSHCFALPAEPPQLHEDCAANLIEAAPEIPSAAFSQFNREFASSTSESQVWRAIDTLVVLPSEFQEIRRLEIH